MHTDSGHINIISPVYKSEKIVSELVKQISENIQSITENYSIILVEDCSPDNSWLEIEKECQRNKKIKGIRLKQNSGQHAAISAALQYAFGEKIIVMDCDLQDAPEDLPKLWKKSQEGYDIVMARRLLRNEKFLRRFLSKSFHWALSLKRGIKTDPTIANYAIYNQKVIREYFLNYKNRAFSILNLKENYTFATVDVIQGISKKGKSGYTLSKLFSQAFDWLFPKNEKRKNKPLYVIKQVINIAMEGYDITLKPLTGEKIEMVRQWRNDPKISQNMEYRKYITPEMQQKWFENICNPNNYYFIIEFENKEIGLINTKNIDYSERCGEGGIFIYDDFYLNSDIAFRASLCQGDFLTKILKLDHFYIYILCQNKKAIRYNKMLGYQLSEGQENIEKQKYILSKEIYLKQRDLITKILS